MFGNRERDDKISTLEREMNSLRERVAKLEADCAPFRVGELHDYGIYPRYVDERPRVSLHQAAQKLMDHCGLRFEKTPVTGGQVVVKDKKDDKMFVQSGGGVGSTALSVLKKAKKGERK